jgi:hypothetical protein
MEPVRRGQRAALMIFVVALGVYRAAAIWIRAEPWKYAWEKQWEETHCRAEATCGLHELDRQLKLAFVFVAVAVAGLVVACTISAQLPTSEAKRAFWLTSLLCMAINGSLWSFI